MANLDTSLELKARFVLFKADKSISDVRFMRNEWRRAVSAALGIEFY